MENLLERELAVARGLAPFGCVAAVKTIKQG
jgi:hypothetical protein